MPLNKRLAWVAASAVALAVFLAAIVCYFVVRHQLLSQVDDALKAQAAEVQQGTATLDQPLPGPSPSAGGPAQYWQIIGTDGTVLDRDLALPVSAQATAVANGNQGPFLSNVELGGNRFRELTFPGNFNMGFGRLQPVAVQLARPLNGIDNVLRDLRLVLLLVCAGGIALAAVLGRVAARRVLAPLAEVAATARHIEETEDLSSRLRVHADDEVGELARRFNAMIERLQHSREALDESVRAQRQLVADASHELRTPITSLRTNIEVLLEEVQLDPEDRRRLLADVVEQSEELTALVGDLIELARGDQPGPETDDVRLDGVAAESLARARRNAPDIRFEATLAPTFIDGVPERLGRAINNLLDNAARHSPPGGPVELQVGPSGVEVRDHGSGVDPEDLPYVFDRFFRGRNSRGRQGSGLGLAIVRQVAEQHGGSASVTNAVDGGAIFTLHLPGSPAEGGEPHAHPSDVAAPTEPVESR